ncbi:putative anthocyanidin synthase [Helianthus annuus]|uniref:Anthocyanidin synthase n=1 Tax=Helianthus annuus TaxID=4232 RepID=A0A251SCP3_HELAN|nr:probable 2-oxoglutarate-dependent dioxygenase At5g05600 isoform X1 [Helianthus annuus]KAF5766896.1 putative anthocyanidin synthase [Helianthus annuus]KAJ0453232.1 putative anthocyanidin synthase [Helianthus annuus]KAJ0475145.1 putative anthocyanidin synthase [Helianthus annuus]KAJ0650701.1 putative anthocyanidin synthase [Helianthus annuus]KAJ0654454.1 putative anthocyanidin synthase [Helianthus annuus]
MGSIVDWPEPVVYVQSLSESGTLVVPDQYIKPPPDRPTTWLTDMNIPVIDMTGLISSREETMKQVFEACREWGFMQLVNHGVKTELLDGARDIWQEFFHAPMEVKKKYANSPKTYEGFGSRLGVEKGATLDWSDYYYLNYHPNCHTKWPAHPPHLRDIMEEYSKEILRLGEVLLKVFSINLGLEEDCLQNAFGGKHIGACLRANFYPKCPQPDLTLGLSSHSDPGGMTFLLPDKRVTGLQVRKDDQWITVKPVHNAIILNIGDQLQVLSNAKYKSVEHRVVVNPNEERVSLAYFYNPRNEMLIQPISELVTSESPALYPPMIFEEYRRFIRTKGPQGKLQVESLKSTR